MNDLVCPRQYRGRDREADLVGSTKIENELDSVVVLDWEVLRESPRQDPLDVLRRQPADLAEVLTIRSQSSFDYRVASIEHCRQLVLPGGIDDQLHLACHHRIRDLEVGVHLARLERLQSPTELLDGAHMSLNQLDTQLLCRLASHPGV